MSRLTAARRLVRAQVSALIVLIAGLAATALITYQLRETTRFKDEVRFNGSAERVQDEVSRRLSTYEGVLYAAAGLLAADPDLEATEFRAFAERLQLPTRLPGIQGIGFSRRVVPGAVDAFIARQRAAGRPDFRIWPEGPREEYHTILYLEPLDRRNRAAIGYDMFTEPTRRGAMERARDTGRPAASGRVTLVQEIDPAKQAGFLLYLPVYRGGLTPATVPERREQLLGFVYSPFRAGDLFVGIFGSQPTRVRFELYDSVRDRAHLLFRSPGPGGAARFETTRQIDIGGRPWSLLVASTNALDEASSRNLVPIVAAVGIALSLVLAALLSLQTRERVRVERSEAALAETSARFRQLADSIPQLVWMARADGWIYWYNQRWYEYTGATSEQMQGWGWQSVHDPKELPRVLERWKMAIAAGSPFEMEFPLRGTDGQFRWFLTRVIPVRDADGQVVQWFGTNTDVQAMRDAEAQVQRLLERERGLRAEAERVSSVKDEFLATLSHELRTPLNAIIGWTQLLIEGYRAAEGQDKALATIQRNARMQARLIDDLLDMSRIISGKVRLDFREVELKDVVEAALNAVRPTAQAKGIELGTTFEPGVPAVLGDANRLQQIAWNLLTNAVKFTPTGGRVRVGLVRRDGRVLLEVSDTGVGIEPDFLPFVFDRFRQADGSTTRQHGGLGLGLSIARSLAEMHGGSVSAHSDGKGRGATFTVSLPLAARVPPPLERRERPASARGGRGSLDGVRVLLVEDDPDALELAQAILEGHGARVTPVTSAPDALRALQAQPRGFHVLVSDLAMPGVDGIELIRRARTAEQRDIQALPAIALSAYARRDDEARALEAGYHAYISKPFDSQRLIDACLAALANRDETRV